MQLAPEDAVKALEERSIQRLKIFSTVAWWPVEDLLIATDYGDTQHAAGQFEPVMYLRCLSLLYRKCSDFEALENYWNWKPRPVLSTLMYTISFGCCS